MKKCLFLKPNKELASTCNTRLQTLPSTQLAFTHNYQGPRVHDCSHSATPITVIRSARARAQLSYQTSDE